MNNKIRTLVITLIAAASIATVAVAPAISQAQDNRSGAAGLTQEDSKRAVPRVNTPEKTSGCAPTETVTNGTATTKAAGR